MFAVPASVPPRLHPDRAPCRRWHSELEIRPACDSSELEFGFPLAIYRSWNFLTFLSPVFCFLYSCFHIFVFFRLHSSGQGVPSSVTPYKYGYENFAFLFLVPLPYETCCRRTFLPGRCLFFPLPSFRICFGFRISCSARPR